MTDQWSEAVTLLMRRFAGWMPWYGAVTGRWWAMPPPGYVPQSLVDAATPDELAEAIGTAPSYGTTAPRDHQTSLVPGTATRCSWRIDNRDMPVRAARKLTAETLASWAIPEAEDAAVLIVSELVSNAARYAAPPITLALTLVAKGAASRSYEVLIEVTDADTRLPVKRNPGESGGFGLTLVESLAKINFVASDSGKTVRALLTTPRGHT
jgi:hypothetical protein